MTPLPGQAPTPTPPNVRPSSPWARACRATVSSSGRKSMYVSRPHGLNGQAGKELTAELANAYAGYLRVSCK